MSDIQGVCCICSRGLVFSKVIEATDRNMESVVGAWNRVFTHDKPIPEAQNRIVEKARQHNPEWLWFVEEDTVPPENALQEMLKFANYYNVIATKYKLPGNTWSSIEVDGDIKFTGLGCALIRVSVFDDIGLPYFVSHRNYDDNLIFTGNDYQSYGGQDVHFFHRLMKCNIPFYVMPDVIPDHLRLVKQGDVTNNVGFHQIEAIT